MKLTARSARRRAVHSFPKQVRPAANFWILAAYLLCAFLMGGGSRSDIASLVILRPLAVLTCAWAVLHLDAGTLRQWRGLLVLTIALFALPIVHLIPLPWMIWQGLPGHRIVQEIDRAIGEADMFRPLSLSPLDTWNALFSLFVPLAVLLLAIGLTDRDCRRLLHVALALGGLSVVLGALQAISPGSTALHFYRIDNPNASDGLFANRNHQALLLACMIPMLTVFAVERHGNIVRRTAIMAAGAVILIPLLLLTGSRAGLVLGVLAILSLPALMPRSDRRGIKTGWQTHILNPKLFVGAGGILLGALFIIFRRAEAFQRLLASTPAEEARLDLWQPAIRATRDFMPFGSGIGSFVSTYKVYETQNLLSATYRNHAHNEFIEVAMTGGVLALLILAVALVAWIVLSWRWMSRPYQSPATSHGRLGAIIILLFAVGSAVDYPARVPSLACLLTLAAIWLCGGDKSGEMVPAKKPLPTPDDIAFTARTS